MVRSSTPAMSGGVTASSGDAFRMRRASAASSTSVPTRGKYVSRMSTMAWACGPRGTSALPRTEVRDDLLAPLADRFEADLLRHGAHLNQAHDLVGTGV